jgi:tetratricopeptide (TPR) repeat protein
LVPLLACAGGEDSSPDERGEAGPDLRSADSTEIRESGQTLRSTADPQFEYAFQDAVAASVQGRLATAAELARAAELRAVELNDLDAALEAAVLPGLWRLWATGEADVSVATVESALSRYAIGELTPPRRVDLILAAFFADAGHTQRGRAFLSRYVQDVRPGVVGQELELPPSYYSAQGAIALAEGRFAEAIRALESAAAGEARDPLAADFRLGLAWERAGARDSATRVYGRFVEGLESGLAGSQPARADAWAVPYALRSLGELYEESGDERKAAGYFESFVELWESADPPLQAEVIEVRERLRGLRR